jgi:ADP-ribose pyrophosphatase YjhB (NUDIX family)
VRASTLLGRVPRGRDVHDLARALIHQEEEEQRPEEQIVGLHEVTAPDVVGVVLDEGCPPLAATAARNAAWFAVDELPTLAFDHAEIVATALARLRGKVRYQPIGFELLPPKFTLSQLQHLYEVVLERPLDKRNFRKKVLSLELLEELDEVEQDVAHRAARLYRFDERRYKKLVKQGFNFEI